MLRYEWKKLLVNRKGLWLIGFLIAAELCSLLLFTQPHDRVLEDNRTVYDAYLQQVEGPLTPESREFLEAEMLRLNAVHARLEVLKEKYYTGSVSEVQYRQEYDTLAAEDQYFQGFSKVYAQYIYVRENDNRAFLYTGGWELLLGRQHADLLYLSVLVFLLIPIFCQEYGCQMDLLGRTQKKSARGLWKAKLFTALLLTAILTAVLQLFDILYCAVRFGLPCWEESIQSLVSFGNTEKALTLWQALVLLFLLKELGYLYAATFLLFVSVLLRKYPLGLMAGLVCLPLPFLAVQDAAAFVRIPGPWAFTVGTLYLSGNRLPSFAEVSWEELTSVTACAGLLMGLMIAVIRRRSMNFHARPRKWAIFGITLAVVFLCGCHTDTETVIYNTRESQWAENETYLVWNRGMENAVLLEKESGAQHRFPLDAFAGETCFTGRDFYFRDHTLYYLQRTRQRATAGFDTYIQQDALMALDLRTMKSTPVYLWKNDPQWFFSLLPKPNTEPHTSMFGSFFLHGSHVYYLANSTLQRMDLATGKYESILTLPNAANLAYDGKSIYYTDAYSRLVIRDLDTGAVRTVEEVTAKDFLLTPEGIYFLNMRASGSLYYWNMVSGSPVKLDTQEAYALHWDPDYCWIETSEGTYRMSHEGKNKVLAPHPGFLLCMPRSGFFYTMEPETGKIYCVDKEDFSSVPVA